MKSQKLFKLVALMLAVVFCAGLVAACDKTPVDDPNKTATPGTSGDPVEGSTQPLVVAYDAFSSKFSPFFGETSYDNDVANITQVGLMTTDRSSAIVYNAINGETRSYNGTEYQYIGASDLTVTTNEETTVYRIKMREDIKFSDGELANIDDVIFYYYVILDPNYDGASTLSSQNIVGYTEYRYNNSKAGEVDPDAVIADIDNNTALQEWVAENIIKKILDEELVWVESLYTNETYVNDADYGPLLTQYPERKDLMYKAFYGTDDAYDPTAHTEEEVMTKLYEEYGYDYELMGNNYAGDPNYFLDQTFTDAAYEIALQSIEGGEEVPNVAGIVRVDDYTVEVTTKGFAANAVYQIGAATITPMHYYGDATLYDYANNKFGFNNRADDSMALIASKTEHPMGAGEYKFIEYKDKVVYFEANENFWKGAPKIKYMQWKETASKDMIAAVATGAADVANVSGSIATFEEIAGYNTDTGTDTGNTISSSLVWNLGYGYIGINAGTVNVGGELASDASKNLRKALATVMAVQRESVIDTYYGDAGAVIEYPISTTSWAAPQTSDEGYELAFAKDVDGNPIYTAEMTADEKYAAALEAAIGFFKAAGYTWDEAAGKFTAAPDGAKLEYEIIIPAGGTGDHPNYAVAQNAAAALDTIGITLTINDPASTKELWDELDVGSQELWTAAWGSTIDPDMYQVYFSGNIPVPAGGMANSSGSNHYQIQDDELDELIIEARSTSDQEYRKTTYKACLDIIMEWAVEIPAYQRKNLVIFSTERINLDTLTKDITTYWGWAAELYLLELNPAA